MEKIGPRIGFQMGKVIDIASGRPLVDNVRGTDGNLLSIRKTSTYGAALDNAMKAELTNDVGGYQVPIDTLTQIAREITTQVFYGSDLKITDYLPVVIGQGAFSQSLLTFKTGSTGNQFKQNIFRSGQNSSMTQANTQIEAATLEILNFAQGQTYSLFEMKQAAMYGNFDVIAAKEEARKTVYDQGILQTAFVGVPEFGQFGLVNQPLGTLSDTIAPDTTIIPKPIGTMDADEINTLVGKLIYTYYRNTGYSRKPSKFIIPTSDYFTLQEYINPEFPLADSQRINILLKAFKSQTGNDNFKILDSIYCQPSEANKIGAGLVHDRYILTVDDSKSLKMLLPVPYTVTLANTINGFEWQNAAYGQFSAVQLLRGKETQYFDDTSSAT